MAPNKNTTIWIFIGVLAAWNLGLTLSLDGVLDWLTNNPAPQPQQAPNNTARLIDALRLVNESELRGAYLNFINEFLMNHQNSLPTLPQIRDLIRVLEELQSKSIDLNYTADFMSSFKGGGGGFNPPGSGSAFNPPVS